MAKMSFKEQMEKLNSIVEKLESNEADIDEALALYKEGKALSKALTEKLEGVEKEIEENE